MDERTERRLHRLLARGRLSRPETDAIRERVLDAIDKKEKRPARVIRIASWTGAVLAAAAAVFLMVRAPEGPGGEVQVPETGELGALAIRCSPGKLSACPASSKLLFSITDGRTSGVLSAYAEPLDHDGPRVFYFSQQDGSAELPNQTAARPVGAAEPGRYRVHAVIAERALTRDELIEAATAAERGAAVRTRTQVDIVVGR